MSRRNPLMAAALAIATATATVVAVAGGSAGASGGLATADEPEGAIGGGRTMLVLDSSGSMAEPAAGGRTKIQAAKAALRTVIGGLPDDASVGFRVFGAEVFSRSEPGACEDSQQVVAPATDNREDLRAAVEDYEPFGETPIPAALRGAAQDLGDEGARSIVLVSDGESNCDPDPCQVAAELTAQGIDLQIDVVGLSVSGAARQQLQCIAERGGGTYYDAEDADDIEASLERASQRAVRPFTLSGEQVEGGSEEQPTALEVGDWVDEFTGEDGEKFYTVEKADEGSTLRISVITQGGADLIQAYSATLAPEGEAGSCSTGVEVSPSRTPEVLSTSVFSVPGGDCDGAAGTYVLGVAPGFGEEGAPVEIRVSEEPEVADVGFDDTADATLTPPSGGGQPQDVVGGTSFDNAAELAEDGSYASDVVAGEAVLFRVPLDFGQGLDVRVQFANDGEVVGLPDAEGQLVVFNPMQSRLGPASDATVIGPIPGTTFTDAVAPVSRAREIGLAARNGVDDLTMAGDYYVSVSLREDEDTEIMPFTLDVQTTGEPAEPPTYVDGVEWSVAEGVSGGQADDGASEPSGDSTDDGSGTPEAADGGSWATTAAGVGLGAAGLIALLAAALLLLRRRRSS